MDPEAKLRLFNAVATAAKTVCEIADHTTKRKTKQELSWVYDTLMDIRSQAASQAANYEDEIRSLKERLGFRSENFDLKGRVG